MSAGSVWASKKRGVGEMWRACGPKAGVGWDADGIRSTFLSRSQCKTWAWAVVTAFPDQADGSFFFSFYSGEFLSFLFENGVDGLVS